MYESAVSTPFRKKPQGGWPACRQERRGRRGAGVCSEEQPRGCLGRKACPAHRTVRSHYGARQVTETSGEQGGTSMGGCCPRPAWLRAAPLWTQLPSPRNKRGRSWPSCALHTHDVGIFSFCIAGMPGRGPWAAAVADSGLTTKPLISTLATRSLPGVDEWRCPAPRGDATPHSRPPFSVREGLG